jgi:hypothetical protein
MAEVRGRCAVCGLTARLRKDGTVGRHPATPDCAGTGKPPKPYEPYDCIDCVAHYYSTPGLVEAIWSVAIESPKPGEQITLEYLQAYHRSGHKGDFLND